MLSVPHRCQHRGGRGLARAGRVVQGRPSRRSCVPLCAANVTSAAP